MSPRHVTSPHQITSPRQNVSRPSQSIRKAILNRTNETCRLRSPERKAPVAKFLPYKPLDLMRDPMSPYAPMEPIGEQQCGASFWSPPPSSSALMDQSLSPSPPSGCPSPRRRQPRVRPVCGITGSSSPDLHTAANQYSTLPPIQGDVHTSTGSATTVQIIGEKPGAVSFDIIF